MTKGNSYSLLIEKLDAFIRKYYLNQLIRGALYFLALTGILFLAFSILEHEFYFGKGVRKSFFYSFIGVSFASLFYWIILPLTKYFKLGAQISNEQAAGIIGNHFSDVKDKLLNVLQLKSQSQSTLNAELIEASINQKSDAISVVSFPKAINLSKNKKYLRYAMPPLMIILALLLGAPSVLTESSSRIIKNNEDFEPDAPFSFAITNPELVVNQFEDFILDVSVNGDVLPDDVFIKLDDFQYRLKKTAPGKFTYTFNNVKTKIPFQLVSGRVQSGQKELSVLLKPHIAHFDVSLDYPRYTGHKDELLSNVGDLVVPQGTNIRWLLKTLHTDSVHFKVNQGDLEKIKFNGKDNYVHSLKARKSLTYQMYVSNSNIYLGDSLRYNINVIPDQYPTISLKTFQDSTEESLRYFVGSISDDYGLSRLSFNYRVKRSKGAFGPLTSEPINFPSGIKSEYEKPWDITDLALKPGDEVEYYFEVFDNDGVNGSKSSKTGIMSISMDTEEELEQKTDKNNEDIKKKIADALKKNRDIQKEIKELREKVLQQKELDWQDRQRLEDLLKQQKEMQNQMEIAKEKMQQNLENQEKLDQSKEELLKKQEKLEEMFNEVLDEEMQKLMDEIQELLQELNKEDALEKMEEMQLSEEEMEQEMDRLLELFKQLEVEKEMQDQIEKLEELAEKEEQLSKDTEEESKSTEELKKEQEDIQKEFEDFKKKQEELEKKNEELKTPKDIPDQKEEMEDVEKDMEDSQEEMEEGEKKKASESQKDASDKMKDMAGKMSKSKESGEQEQAEEDLKTMRQLLENLINLSFDEEDLLGSVSRANTTTPYYVTLVQEQHKLRDDFSLIEDSLTALASRNFQIEAFITQKVNEISSQFDKSLTLLEERNRSKASTGQRTIMKNVNDLALMLSEAMAQMQKAMAEKKPGNQMCQNPGGNGKGKSGKVPSDKIGEGQKKLGEGLKKLKEGLEKGGKGGQSKEFAQAAARQAAMRKALEQIQKDAQEKGQGSQGLQEIIDQMDKMETDLVNKRLNNETFKRQQDIETRLLQAEKAEQKREKDNKRKSETAREVERKLPPSLQEYLKKRENELELYQKVAPELRPYYKFLVEEYYKSLKNSSD